MQHQPEHFESRRVHREQRFVVIEKLDIFDLASISL